MLICADLHVHSAASPDGRSAIEALMASAKQQGIQAIAICDHNRCTPLPKGSEVLLIPGTEVSTTSGHILGLFLQKPLAWSNLCAQQALPCAEDAIAEIHRCGGIAVLAHPFQHSTANPDALAGWPLDAVECANARADMKNKSANTQAKALAHRCALPQTGGSDAHSAGELGNCVSLIESTDSSLEAIKAAILAGHCQAVFHRPCRWVQKGCSQFVKARRSKNMARLCKAGCYLGYCALRDLLHL